jgi:hypothetical protein
MLLGGPELSHGSRRDSEGHVSFGHSYQDLAVRGDGKRLLEVRGRLRRTAQRVPALCDVGEHPCLDVQVGLARTLQPLQRPQAGLDRRVEQLLFTQRGADLRVDDCADRWMIGWRERRRLLKRPQALSLPTGCPQRDAAESTRIGALVRSQLILSNFVEQRERAPGLAGLYGELRRLHEVLDIGRGSAVQEVGNGTAEPIGQQLQPRERWGGLIVLHLADEAFGGNARRQSLLGQSLGNPGGLETFAK